MLRVSVAVAAALLGSVGPVPAGERVAVVRLLGALEGTSPLELRAARDEVERLWEPAGVTIVWGAGMAPADFEVMLTTAEHTSASSCTLGEIWFVNGRPQARLLIRLDHIRQVIAAARRGVWGPPRQSLATGRVAGRVIAHELGHFLLASREHDRSGLMRARISTDEWLGSHRSPFAVSSASIRALRQSAAIARLRDSRAEEGGTP